MQKDLTVPDHWTQISHRVEGFVRHFFRRRPEIDPADVTQEVLLQLLRQSQTVGNETDIPALALVVTRRRCIDALRRSYVSRRIVAGDLLGEVSIPSDDPPADDVRERGEVSDLFRKLRGRLSPRCRTVLDQLLLGWRLADVARSLGISSGAVRNRWFDCRRQIRNLLREWGIAKQDLLG